MDKKTQMYVGVGVLAVAAYLAYKKMQDKKMMVTPMAAPTTDVKEFAGMDYNTVVGDRKRMVGLVAANKDVQDSGWVRGADGSSIAPTFFDVQSSDWVRGSMN